MSSVSEPQACTGIVAVNKPVERLLAIVRIVAVNKPVERLLAFVRIVAVNLPMERLVALVRLRGGKRFAFSSPQTPHLLPEISRDKEWPLA